MFKVWADGSVRNGNPGLGGIAFVVKHIGSGGYIGCHILEGDKTNNEAEYIAVIKSLEYLTKINSRLREDCIIYTDSALVQGQVMRGWKINFDHLRKLNKQVRDLINSAGFKIKLELINREKNSEANGIVQNLTAQAKGEDDGRV